MIHHGPAAGSELTLAIAMVETALRAALVAAARTPFAELASSSTTIDATVNLALLTITAQVKESLAPRASPFTKR